MKKPVRKLFWEKGPILAAVFVLLNGLPASTTFMGVNGDQVYAATNEDTPDPAVFVTYLPSDGKLNGAVLFGSDASKPVGGMNEVGLFCNLADTPRWQVERDPGKKTLFGNLIENILTSCSTVDDVLELEENYNLYDLHQTQILVADRHGKALILEGNNIIHRDKDFLLITNFYQSRPDSYPFPKNRFEIAERMLADGPVTEKKCIKVLAATHRELERPTMYSYLCDLQAREIHVFRFHDYANGITLSVNEASKGERRTVALDDLFTERMLAFRQYLVFQRKNGIDTDIQNGQIVQALAEIRKWFLEDENFDAYPEYELNMLGYRIMGAGDIAGAVEVFKLNVELYPQSGNVYDSLGEGYMNLGETGLAILNYEKSLEIDPGNTNAVEMLERLRSE